MQLRPYLCPLIITGLLLLPMLMPSTWQTALEYQRQAIGGGEPWRLVSGHLMHLGWGHLLMNLLGFWLIWQLFLRQDSRLSVCIGGLLLLTLGISLGLYLFSPGIAWYRGLSGVLHGVLLWSLLREMKPHPLSSSILLGLLMAKLLWEQTSGPIPGSETVAQGRVIVDAHLYGGLSGALLWVIGLAIGKYRREEVE
ncbi:MAG: rhombosortase [Pseudomonadota bacterium]